MPKIFTAAQIRKIDAYTIKKEPIKSVDLMERAAKELCKWIRSNFAKDTQFLFLVGPGNNGGDGWALARLLFHHGYENIRFYLLGISDKLSPDSEKNRKRLIGETDIRLKEIKTEEDFPFISNDDWVVDALFGSGLTRPLDGLALELVEYVNDSEAIGVISVDTPSGLFGEDNTNNSPLGIIEADFTLSLQFPKLAFYFSDNEDYVGEWGVLPIGLHPDIIESERSPYFSLTQEELYDKILYRSRFSHKGTFGHALIIAGSYGMMGAAILATRAAVKSGAGLVTAHVPRYGYEIIQNAIPEAIVSIDESDLMFTGVNKLENYTAICLGPGINKKTNTCRAVIDLLEEVNIPLLIDADGLNIISEHKDWLDKIPEGTILTPHPREFDRLTKNHDSHYQRFITQQEFAKKYKVIVVLKGAHSSIATPEGEVWFNTTGNPGMAKGGSGDVLSGIITSLLAQHYSPVDAALIGVFIHGLAGDFALKSQGVHALTPTDIISKLGKAFKKIE